MFDGHYANGTLAMGLIRTVTIHFLTFTDPVAINYLSSALPLFRLLQKETQTPTRIMRDNAEQHARHLRRLFATSLIHICRVRATFGLHHPHHYLT